MDLVMLHSASVELLFFLNPLLQLVGEGIRFYQGWPRKSVSSCAH